MPSGSLSQGQAAHVRELSDLATGEDVSCDILIIGGGAAGLTLARGLDGTGFDVLIAESGGLEEAQDTDTLNRVLTHPANWNDEQIARRESFHGPQTRYWSHENQNFGVRCRGLGGSTSAWAGKSATFDEMDFAARPWIPQSGWPVDGKELSPFLDRAAELLNLSANCYDDNLWSLMGRNPPLPRPDPEILRSFFWQFARSTISPMEVMHLGREFLHRPPANARVLTGATAVKVLTEPAGSRVTGALFADRSGATRTVRAGTVVLATSTIENARLLLVSNDHRSRGLGNDHDNVGRYLLDHPSAALASFDDRDIAAMAELFGFYGLKHKNGSSMYMRGLAPTPTVQKKEKLLNCAVYFQGERAPDDPFNAAKRLLRRRSQSYSADIMAVLKSPGLVAKGLGRLAFQSEKFPKPITRFVVNQLVRFRPNMVAEEYLTQGVPHKLTGLKIIAVCEQAPDPDNRVVLSTEKDRFGTPLPLVNWRIGNREAHTMARFAHILRREFAEAGLPAPQLEIWTGNGDLGDIAVIDMAHSAGTTRMSIDPRNGVVDRNCMVHGVQGLFAAGASVFPTSGHANPTLMVMGFALRLADHLKGQQ
ncbi:GMC oxidoreductase [Marimonas lutisalis]|uniref:GMC oxidoreductase n=1 Tax=Marimonas lutisalis TaxID=2545756 RepID=UPI0010F94E4E|nr:GMC family oxidoreductase [Marimonas lutisalis]